MSGFELQQRLTADQVVIPIIFITGNDDASTRERADTSGAAAYLCKPFDDELLLDAIRGVIRGGSRLRTRFIPSTFPAG
jgi:FixJ family two-component response regulator